MKRRWGMERVKRSDAEISVYYLSLFQLLTLIGPFTCWTLCWTFYWTLLRGLTWSVCRWKFVFAPTEINEELAVAPVSITRHCRPTCRPHGEQGQDALRSISLLRRHSNLASVCIRFLPCDEDCCPSTISDLLGKLLCIDCSFVIRSLRFTNGLTVSLAK